MASCRGTAAQNGKIVIVQRTKSKYLGRHLAYKTRRIHTADLTKTGKEKAKKKKGKGNGDEKKARERPASSGQLRQVPCLGCVRSALRGRSDGLCYDTVGGGTRCWRCASGHSCVRLYVLILSLRLITWV